MAGKRIRHQYFVAGQCIYHAAVCYSIYICLYTHRWIVTIGHLSSSAIYAVSFQHKSLFIVDFIIISFINFHSIYEILFNFSNYNKILPPNRIKNKYYLKNTDKYINNSKIQKTHLHHQIRPPNLIQTLKSVSAHFLHNYFIIKTVFLLYLFFSFYLSKKRFTKI